MSITVEELQALVGRGLVLTDRGEKVGSIGQIYVDDATALPDWVTVRTGLFGTAETFVPLAAARVEGSDLVVPHAKDLIKGAPRIEVDGSLSPEEEKVLYRHYRAGADTRHGDDAAIDGSGDHAERFAPIADADAAMIRSEERVVVGTEVREAGRARLRKYVVTEHVTRSVAVRHEEVRLTREPIAAPDRESVAASPTFQEEQYELVLHVEAPVLERTVVPVERVRLDTVTKTGQASVSAEVRKERVELDESTAGTERAAGSITGRSSTDTTANRAKGTGHSTPKGKKGTRRRR